MRLKYYVQGHIFLYNRCNIFENLIDFRTVLNIDVLCDTILLSGSLRGGNRESESMLRKCRGPAGGRLQHNKTKQNPTPFFSDSARRTPKGWAPRLRPRPANGTTRSTRDGNASSSSSPSWHLSLRGGEEAVLLQSSPTSSDSLYQHLTTARMTKEVSPNTWKPNQTRTRPTKRTSTS